MTDNIKVLLCTAKAAVESKDYMTAITAMRGAVEFMEDATDGMPVDVAVASDVYTSKMRKCADDLLGDPWNVFELFRITCQEYATNVLKPWLLREVCDDHGGVH